MKILTNLLYSAILLILGACQSPPPHTVSYMEMQESALRLLKLAIYVQSAQQYIASNSSDVHNDNYSDGNVKTSDSNVKTSNASTSDTQPGPCLAWQTQYWPLVAGADEFYRASLRNEVFDFAGEAFAPLAYEFYLAERARAELQVRQLFRRGGADAVCAAEVLSAQLEPGLADQLGQELLAYGQHSKLAPGSRIPSLAGSRDLNSEPGRSYFAIERAAKTDACAQPRLYVLLNHWPEEAYIAVCGQTQQQFNCLWGDCRPAGN